MTLSPKTEDIILSLRAAGLSLRQIQKHAEISIDRKVISRTLKSNGVETTRSDNIWSDDLGAERTAFLKKAWGEPQKYPSLAAIAQALTRKFGRTVTKNAIIGKSRRLKLTHRGEESMPRVAFQKGFSRSSSPAVQAMRAESAPRPPFTGATLRLDPMPEDGITFEQLKTGMCRFALGLMSDPVLFFCGEETFGGDRNYCARHRAVVWRPRRSPFEKDAA